MPKQERHQSVINVTFQLKGKDADAFRGYMEREYIRINSVAGQKLALERLSQLESPRQQNNGAK